MRGIICSNSEVDNNDLIFVIFLSCKKGLNKWLIFRRVSNITQRFLECGLTEGAGESQSKFNNFK